MVGHFFTNISQVGSNNECLTFVRNGITHIIARIMAYRKRLNDKIAYGKVFSLFEIFSTRIELFCNAIITVDALMNFFGGIYGNVVFFAKYAYRANMVGMVVRDKNAPNLI